MLMSDYTLMEITKSIRMNREEKAAHERLIKVALAGRPGIGAQALSSLSALLIQAGEHLKHLRRKPVVNP